MGTEDPLQFLDVCIKILTKVLNWIIFVLKKNTKLVSLKFVTTAYQVEGSLVSIYHCELDVDDHKGCLYIQA